MQVDPQDAVVDAIPARPLPLAAAAARLAGLDIEARFRTIAVPFPSMLEVGTCFTQVTKRDRPVPFTLDRIAFEAPQAAIDEADGATIVLEYRFLARSGRIIEAARCRVPKSQLAIDQVFGQFTEYGLGARRGPLKAALAKGTSGLANGWVVSVDPGSFLQGGVVATMSGDGLCGTEENPCILDGVETEQCDSEYQEWDEDLNECYCENGSDELDCWIDPNPEGPGSSIPPEDGGGSVSNGSHEPLAPDEAAEDWFLKLPEVDCDGPPLSDPAKEAARKAWCQSILLGGTDSSKVNAALDRIQGAGGICVALASLGRELLNTQMLKKFAPFANNPSAATNMTQRGITIHAIWLGEREMPNPNSHDPRSLQFTLAHELDHLTPWAEGGQGPGHIAKGIIYTRNSEKCGGGGAV